MKRINLIIPPSPWLISDTDIPSLGVLYLSAYLKDKGFDVVIDDLTGEKLSDWWPGQHYDAWGITGSSPNFPQMKIIADRIRTVHPKALIVAGGPHATLAPDHLLQNSAIDTVIQGPGEKRFTNLLEGKWEENPEDYKMAPIPDYEAIDFKKYLPSKTFKYVLGEVNESPIFTTLGCPHRCAFCGQHNMRKKTRHIPTQDIMANIKHLQNKYDVKLFYVTDDTFGFNHERFADLCQLFKNLGIHWHCLLRADMATKLRLEMMKNSGCLGVVYGFESGSTTMLNYMNKRTKSHDNYNAAKLTHEIGLKVRGQMVVGFPGETNETIEETKRFIKESPVDYWGIHYFQPFPGSDVWQNPEKYGITIDKNTDFSDWHTIGKPTEKSKNDQVQKWVEELREIAGIRNIERVCE